MTGSLDPANRRLYRRRASPMLFLGLMLFLVGLRGYVVPASAEDTAAHEILGGVAYTVWHAGLTVSGLLLLIGLGPRLLPEIEVLGLWVGLWAIAIHILAVMKVFGALLASPTIALAITLMWVLWIRLSDLRIYALRDRRQIDAPYGGRERRG